MARGDLKRIGNLYKNSTGSLTFNDETGLGYSYGWYEIAKVMRGKRVLNTYYYSSTTSQHVGKLRGQFHFDIEIEAPYGLQNVEKAIAHYEHMILDLKATIARPRSTKKKNEERQAEIDSHKAVIDFLKGCE